MDSNRDNVESAIPLAICTIVATTSIKLFNQIIEMNTYSILHSYCHIEDYLEEDEKFENKFFRLEGAELVQEITDFYNEDN